MDKTEIQEMKIRAVIGEKTDLPELNGRTSLISLVKGIALKILSTPESIHNYGVTGLDSVITLNTGENFPSAIQNDGTNIYTCISGNPGKLIEFELKTFTKTKTLTFDVGEMNPTSLALHGEYIYIGLGTNPGKIIKVHKESFTKISTLTFAAGESTVESIFPIGLYLYSGLNSGHLIRSDLDTFLEVDAINLGDQIKSITSDGNYIYAALLTTKTISKINIDPFTLNGSLVLGPGEDGPISMIISGEYLYVGLTTPSPPIIAKINLYTFTELSTITLNLVGATNLTTMLANGTYLFAGTLGGFGATIELVDLATFTEVSIMDTGFGVWALHTDETYIYAGMINLPNPGKIARRYLVPTTDRFQRIINIINSNTSTVSTDLTTIDGIVDTLLEQMHTGTYYIYPANAAPASVQSGVGAYTKGNYTEVIPVNTVATTFYIVGMYINLQTAAVDYELDIATGAAGAEVVIATESAMYSSTGRSFDMAFPIPIKVAANTRVAVRCSDAVGSKITLVKIRYKD